MKLATLGSGARHGMLAPTLDSMMGGRFVSLERAPGLQYGADVKHPPA
jgi:hypothetical protein